MEVKSIFVNLILKSYEKHDSPSREGDRHEPAEEKAGTDAVTISPQASRRLFGELMEHSLKKGLSGVCADEN